MCAALFFLAVACAAGFAQAGACVAQSARATVAFVELYTSKTCKVCRQAEQRLAELRAHHPTLLPVLLHVAARDYAEDRPPERRNLTPLQRLALVHTPRLLLQGREQRWDAADLGAALARIERTTARALVRLQIVSFGAEGIEAHAAAADLRSDGRGTADLYVAAYADRPSGYLVLEWQGPFAVQPDMWMRRMLALPAGTAAAASGVIGFVQDRRTSQVLQALRLSVC